MAKRTMNEKLYRILVDGVIDNIGPSNTFSFKFLRTYPMLGHSFKQRPSCGNEGGHGIEHLAIACDVASTSLHVIM